MIDDDEALAAARNEVRRRIAAAHAFWRAVGIAGALLVSGVGLIAAKGFFTGGLQ